MEEISSMNFSNQLYELNSSSALSTSSSSQLHESNSIQSGNNGHHISSLTRHPAAKAEVKENCLTQFLYNVCKWVVRIFTLGLINLDSKSNEPLISQEDRNTINVIQALNKKDASKVYDSLAITLKSESFKELLKGTRTIALDMNNLENVEIPTLVEGMLSMLSTRPENRLFARTEVFNALLKIDEVELDEEEEEDPLPALKNAINLMNDSEKILAKSLFAFIDNLLNGLTEEPGARFSNTMDSLSDHLFLNSEELENLFPEKEFYELFPITHTVEKAFQLMFHHRNELFA